MNTQISKSWPIIFVLMIFVFFAGCSDSGKQDAKPVSGESNIQGSVPGTPPADVVSSQPEQKLSGDVVVSVDGTVLKKSELDKSVNERFKMIKDKIPPDKQKEFKENLKKQLVEVFIARTLLSNEIEKRKIEASAQEVKMAMDQIKASLPPNKKIEDFFKENRINQEDIILAVKIDKFRNMEMGQNIKPSQKEISKFYNDNKDKLFVEPESVHVRHILVAVGKDDNDKVKAEKKSKMENLRKQLNNENFVELARKNSDCPSKEVGGDLSFIKRGQMVKEFENAAFSQEKNVIGPVIKTEFGYHVVQVLDKKSAKKITLDEAKGKISTYLEQRKKIEAFNDIMKKLREKAKIAYNK